MWGTISRTTIQEITHVIHKFAPSYQLQKASIRGGRSCQIWHFYPYDLASSFYNKLISYTTIITTGFIYSYLFVSTKNSIKDIRLHLIPTSNKGVKTTLKAISNILRINFRYLLLSGNYNKNIEFENYNKSGKIDLPLMPVNPTYYTELPLECISLKRFLYNIVPQQKSMQKRLSVKTCTVNCTHHAINWSSIPMYLQTTHTCFKLSFIVYLKN